MELRELYRAILETLGYVVDERGNVFVTANDTLIPVTIKDESDKRLVVPFDEVLRNPDWEHTVAFHPLSENVVRTDSAIFKWLQNASLLYLNANIGWVMSQLLYYCSSTDAQKDLNYKQNVFLSHFSKADEESYNRWNKIQDKVGNGNFFVKVITLRDKKLNGEGYSRTTQVTFPFFKELKELFDSGSKERSIWGVQLRKKDVEGYLNLMKFIFEGIETPETAYSFGSRSMTAPSFHSLINSVAKLAKDVRKVACLLKLEDVNDLKWTKFIDDITGYRSIVPPLAGNEGNVTETERRQIAQSVKSAPKVAPPPAHPVTTLPQPVVQQPLPIKPVAPQPMVAPVVSTPVAQVTPPPLPVTSTHTTSPGKISMSQLMPQAQPQPMMYAPQPQVQPQAVPAYMQPQPMMQPMGYQQPVQQASNRWAPVMSQPPQYGYPQQPMHQQPMGYQQPVGQYGYNQYPAVGGGWR